MTLKRRRIGMFDSGLGGLTVLRQLRAMLPDAEVIYAADTARVPYGDRSLRQVAGFARGIISHLTQFDPSLIAIACGTSCSAFDALGYPASAVPIVPVVDCGARAAARVTRNGKIGVIATVATARSGVFERKIREALPLAFVTSVGAPELVPLVESGAWETPEADEAVATYCGPFARANCDTVVLGCTHFPLLRASFRRALDPGIELVDPALACARKVAELLEGGALGDGSLTFLVSGETGPFVSHAALLGVTATHVRRMDFSDQVKHAEHR